MFFAQSFFLTNSQKRTIMESLFKEQIYFSTGESSQTIQKSTILYVKEVHKTVVVFAFFVIDF